ncbi:MAG: hypothetical protein ACKPJD_31590, partial [Planctomycetaceae bacterium]
RQKLLQKLVDNSPQKRFMSDYQQESLLRSMDNAWRLLSSVRRFPGRFLAFPGLKGQNCAGFERLSGLSQESCR